MDKHGIDSFGETNRKDWSNYWQGRAAKTGGEALMGVGVEHSDALAEFWTEQFKDLPKSARIVDIACGAGSVLRHANNSGLLDLTGIDISEDAISVLMRTLPNAKGIVTPAHKLALPSDSVDVVVSQFGFEYAGDFPAVEQAVHEMARILKPTGQFIAIVHMSGGAIEAESAATLGNIGRIHGSGFIESAKAMFSSGYALNADPSPERESAFKDALIILRQCEAPIAAWLQSPAARDNEFANFVNYLVGSTREMFDRRAEVKLADALKWLDDMSAELEAYRGRMLSMIRAALTADNAQRLLDIFAKAKFEAGLARPFHFGESASPAAWVLRAG